MTATALWIGGLMIALCWPSHTLTVIHGAPLDGQAAALVVGLVVPFLAWLHPAFFRRRSVRALIVLLVVVKVVDAAMLTQQGLCAKFSVPAPYVTNVLTIPIAEPEGALHSWDVRADWRADHPSCTAIVDRAYTDVSSFPAWFVNITDFGTSGKRQLALDISGYAQVSERGLFVVEVGSDMTADGHIGREAVSSVAGRPMLAALESGTHRIDLHASLTGDRWRFLPTWNGRDAFVATKMTVREARAVDRAAGAIGSLEIFLITVLIAAWVVSVVFEYRASPALLAWSVASSCVLVAYGTNSRFERFAVVLLAAAVLVPVAPRHRHLRGVTLMLGVPWLALIAARSLPQVAHFTAYSNDDWLAYQVAGYRIFMNGFWLEGGSKSFDYQPLYRWISGGLHLVFGDSSVGETYWDAVCLMLGAGVTFVLVDRTSGFRWGVAAAVATLATFWLGTIWYFVGRGLSEIAAAGWGFIAALLLWKHSASAGAAIAAGIFAVLMFYTRLNHLLFALFLIALIAPFSWRPALGYLATFAAGVALFAARTWWYTGRFSILYGTSLKNNDTGLRLTTIADSAVWARIWHSLRALVWMNEPPSPDPRAILVVAGVLLSVGTLLQLPRLNRLPVAIAIVTLGACVSSVVAHTHNYPGRMSIHLAPFAIAMTITAGAKLFTR